MHFLGICCANSTYFRLPPFPSFRPFNGNCCCCHRPILAPVLAIRCAKSTCFRLQITPYRAGHVLGAAMFMVDIKGMRALYTGDYSRVEDRHMSAADLPSIRPHIVIVESTYGVSRHEPRVQREERFLKRIADTVKKGGKVLLPIVALGRAQVRALPCCR